MKKKLSITDRIHLLNMLPQENNAVTLRIIRDLKKKLSFSEWEIKEYEMTMDGTRVKWSEEKAKPKEVEFGDTALELIKKELEKLDKEMKLHDTQLEVYDKFMVE